MRISIIAVGKIKDRSARDWLQDYYQRIGRYVRFEEVELKDGDEAEVTERFLRALPADRRHVVAMDVDGRTMSSEDLSRFVTGHESTTQHLVFLIGGSYGLPPAVRKLADTKLSLSAMILPHRLARVFLAEQIYRAFTLSRGEPYSH